MNNYRNDTVTGKDRLVNHKFGNWSNREGINLSNLNEVFPTTSISKFPTNVEEFKYFTQQKQHHHPPNNSSSSSICIHSLPHRNHNFLSMTTSLTNNNNNENKSIEHQNTSLILQQQQQSNNNIFLHRSPSGAQRKIRQKAQQQFQQQSGGMSQNVVNKGGNNGGGGGGNTEPVNNNNNLKQIAYRNLINENGYHSLLGSDNANNNREAATITSSTTNLSSDELERLSAGQLIDRMNKLESITRSPQQQQFPNLHSFESSWKAGGTGINNNTGGCSIDKMPSSLTLQSFQLEQKQQPATNTFAFRKPTVQVHPLPIPPRHHSSASLISDLLNSSTSPKPLLLNPPPLPPKKQSLLATQLSMAKHSKSINQGQQQQNNDKFTENPSPSPNNNSQQFPQFPPPMKQLITTQNYKNENLKTSLTDNNNQPSLINSYQYFSSPPPSQTTTISSSTSSSLSSSPSLASLQNSLYFAIENPEKHSIEQLRELEKRRIQSIESLARKATDREQDKELLLRDLEEIKQLIVSLFERIQQSNKYNNELLIDRLQTFCEEIERIADLDILLNCQQKQLIEQQAPKFKRKTGISKINEIEMNEKEEWNQRLQEQITDLQSIQKYLNKREKQLDAEIAYEFGGDVEALQEWLFCKEQLLKLCSEKRLLDEKLREVKRLINSLEEMCLLPEEIKQEDSKGSREGKISELKENLKN
uniref:ASD2 domain-containing protein n=1 Tax=Meloidogyne incognita TaxID=6306 RepID=A0A914L261_MELIC